MRIGLRAGVISGTVMVAATSSWVSLQVALSQRHGEAAFEHLASAVELVALSVVAVILVAAGRRRVWLPLALVVMGYPTLATMPHLEMRPIGDAWASPIGGGSALVNVGGLVDLLVVLLPAVSYLLSSRRSPVPNNPPTRKVVEMVAAPVVALGAVLATYGLAEVRGGADERVVAATVVLLTAGLLASTSLGVFRASVVTTIVAVITVQNGDLTSVPLVVTAALPLASVALTGAVCAVHGPAIALAYRARMRLRRSDVPALSA
jgi:hypothetical protein